MLKHAFRNGFLAKMSELGIDPEHMRVLLAEPETRTAVAQAFQALTKAGKVEIEANPADVITASGKTLKGLALMGLAIPPLAGGLLGYTLAPRTSKQDIRAMKDMELLREYQTAINKLEGEKKRERRAIV